MTAEIFAEKAASVLLAACVRDMYMHRKDKQSWDWFLKGYDLDMDCTTVERVTYLSDIVLGDAILIGWTETVTLFRAYGSDNIRIITVDVQTGDVIE